MMYLFQLKPEDGGRFSREEMFRSNLRAVSHFQLDGDTLDNSQTFGTLSFQITSYNASNGKEETDSFSFKVVVADGLELQKVADAWVVQMSDSHSEVSVSA